MCCLITGCVVDTIRCLGKDVLETYRESGDDYLLVFHTLYEQYLTVSPDRAIDEEFTAVVEDYMTPVWTDGVRYTLYGWKGRLTTKTQRTRR